MLYHGETVAARIPSKAPDYVAWVGIVPFKINARRVTAGPRYPSPFHSDWANDDRLAGYLLRCFDLPANLDPDRYEIDDYVELRECRSYYSLPSLEKALKKWLDDLNTLDYAWRCDYPL